MIYLSGGHPYVAGMDVHRVGCEVRWRDLHTVKQERSFKTEQDARNFAFMLKACALVVDDEKLGGDPVEALRHWLPLPNAKRSAT